MTFVLDTNSREVFPNAQQVFDYNGWSTFMDSHAIAFDTSAPLNRNSREVFSNAQQVSGYNGWSAFMNSYAIAFDTSDSEPENLLDGRISTDTTLLYFPKAGTYTVICAADNKYAGTTLSVAGQSCNIGGLDTSGEETPISISSPGDYQIIATIKNGSTGSTSFSDNPMGIAFTIIGNPLHGRKNSQTATITFPEAGYYKVTCAADNADESETTLFVAGQSCTVGALTSPGESTPVYISEAKNYDIVATIKNEDAGTKINSFSGNPMGMAFTITRERLSGNAYIPSTVVCDSPTPWNPPIPTCTNAPSVRNSANGINVTKNGVTNSVIINLSNYANKLVSIDFSHQVNSSWDNELSFDTPEASDILVNNTDVGGNPYSKNSYSNSNMPNSSSIILANLDGGNYDYTFNHNSVTVPTPTRTNYTRDCTESTADVDTENGDGTYTRTAVTTQTCGCNEYTETYSGTWPPCPTGISIIENGGSTVKWAYSDGSGEYGSQISTLTVSGARPIVPGGNVPVTLAIADQSLYMRGMTGPRFSVGSYRQYVNASLTNRLRFRDPVNRESKSELVTEDTDENYDNDNYAAFSEFRLYAGAEPPS